MKCPKCNLELSNDWRFCPDCKLVIESKVEPTIDAINTEHPIPSETATNNSNIQGFGGNILNLIIFIIFFGGIFFSVFSPPEYVVKVTGSQSMSFKGAIATTRFGSSTSKSLSGTVPYELKASGDMVSVCFQKQKENGDLRLQIFKNGKLIQTSDTSASYGVVLVAAN